jgi:hypothetical protein
LPWAGILRPFRAFRMGSNYIVNFAENYIQESNPSDKRDVAETRRTRYHAFPVIEPLRQKL